MCLANIVMTQVALQGSPLAGATPPGESLQPSVVAQDPDEMLTDRVAAGAEPARRRSKEGHATSSGKHD